MDGANLEGAFIKNVTFDRTFLAGSRFSRAEFGWNLFADTDLRQVRGLDEVSHTGPSTVGVDTLYRSAGLIPAEFLRGCGIPEVMIDYIPSLTVTAALSFYSCFISYSHADSRFADRLYRDLYNKGRVSCWMDTHALVPGDKLDVEIDRAIRRVDKVVLLCSESVLEGPRGGWWVDREITRALREEERLSRERNEVVTMIIPVDLDGFLFSPKCTYYRAADLRERVALHLVGWDADPAVYETGYEAILKALRLGGPRGMILPPRQL